MDTYYIYLSGSEILITKMNGSYQLIIRFFSALDT